MSNKILISEEEKNEILTLHRGIVKEQAYSGNQNVTQQPVTTQTTTQTTTQQPATQPSPIQLGVKNDKVVTIQTKLNEKIAAKQIPNVTSPLVVDGKWGPKTAYAITQFLGTQDGQSTPSLSTKPAEQLNTTTPSLSTKPAQQVNTNTNTTPELIQQK